MSAIMKYDTGPLNWVRNDIEAALQAALGRVQAFTADPDLTNALRLARDDAHQVMGALRMVGLEGAATVASALEVTLADINEGRQSGSDDVFRAVRNTIEGLSRWIKELAEGRGTGELALFPLYRRLRELQGAERVFEGELFFPDLRSRVQGMPRAIEQSSDTLAAQIKTIRSAFQRGLLAFLRGQNGKQGLQQMRQALAEVEKVAPSQAAQTFWWACVGFVDSLIAQGVEADFYVKQLLARIDLQMRRLMEGSPQVAERLLRDALFFVAKSQTLEGRAAEVRETFSLDQYLPGKGLLDPETLARMRPVLASLKTGLKNARDIWHAHVENANAGQVEDFQAQLIRMHDQAGLVGAESLPALLTQLTEAAGASVRLSGTAQEQINLEIAATLLFLQNAVESEEILRADFITRARSQGERLTALMEGRALPQAEALLDSQSQAVAERDLLHHLAQEVSSNLKQIEEALDLFFRDAGQREGLAQLGTIAAQAQGALVMLELQDASDLLGAAVKAVEQYVEEGYPVDAEKDRIADAFSSLGLYIEAHCAGRADAGRILQPVMAGFGLACEYTGPEAVANDSVEAGLDARKASVASAYLGWRDEGGEEAAKKFLEILIELGRDAELIDDGALKHGVETLLAASRAVTQPGIELDDQVSKLTHTALPARVQPAEQPTLDQAPEVDFAHEAGLAFDLPSFDMPEIASFAKETDPVVPADLPMQSFADAPAPAQPVIEQPTSSVQTILATVPSDSDAELLEIFLEEAGEVLATLTDAIETCRLQPDDRESLTTIRRGFHTLKGSGRMVGLTDFGEAAWGLEQFMNKWLADNKTATGPCLELIDAARQLFQEWVNALVSHEPVALPVPGLLAATESVANDLPYPGLVTAEAIPPIGAPDTLAAPQDSAPPEALLTIPEPEMVEDHEATIPTEVFAAIDDATNDTAVAASSLESTSDEAVLPEPELVPEIADDLVVGDVHLSPGLFDIFMAEAQQRVGSLQEEMQRLSENSASAISETAQRAIHTLSGIAGTAGFAGLASLAHALEMYWHRFEFTPMPSTHHALVHDIVHRMQDMLGQIAAHDAPQAANDLIAALGELEDERAFNVAPFVHEDAPVAMEAQPLSFVTEAIAPTEAEAITPHVAEEIAPIEAEANASDAPLSFAASIEYARPTDQVVTAPEVAMLADAPEACDPAVDDVESAQTDIPFAAMDMREPADTFMPEEAMRDDGAVIAEQAPALVTEALIVEDISATDAVAHPVIDEAISPEITEADSLSADVSVEPAEVDSVAEAPTEPVAGYGTIPNDVDTTNTPDADAPVAEMAPSKPNVGLGSIDLTDLVPEAPQKVVAPVFERRNVTDEIDQDLLPIFMDEAEALVPETSAQLRLWKAQPTNKSALNLLRRNLHTLKGSARMVGAMRLGELTHVMESRIIAIDEGEVEAAASDFEALEAQMDRLANTIENLKRGDFSAPSEPEESSPAERAASPSAEVPMPVADQAAAAAQSVVRDAQALTLRVRADWVDRMVNQAGEVAIARSRIESEVFNFKRHVGELSEALVRLRAHIREVEIQAESQMQSNFITHGKGEHFDPLEFDRFTRFQEVTRFLAESVNDISTIQHILMARLGEADAALLHQTRLNRELQQSLLRVRMVPMYSVAERLYRTVRQTARDVGKRAQLDIQGGDLEIDRSVLEKVTAPLEHLLRNALAHGIENPEARKAAGKTEFGEITLSAQQSGNEMLLIVKDDGAGLNYDRIREKALAHGMLTPGIEPSEAQLAQMIFAAGFSTAEKVSEVSGRGVGMDVVKSEIAALGGRIDITSVPGQGTQFSIYLPLTLAMTQAVMFSAGKQDYALPTTLVQQVLELKPEPLAKALAAGEIEWRGTRYPLTYLPHLLGHPEAVHEVQLFNRVVLLKSGNSVAAVLVDTIEGTREIVVKNIGPQLARVTGIAGATVRGDGRVVLILNPVPLALRWMSQPKEAREYIAAHVCDAPETQLAPLVLVVDDSLTVRKITGRLLTREGYRMDTAKDGVDALEKMHDLIPDVVLLDVEMPRMDGFELARVMRNDPRLKAVPIIMITSRTADKHRNHALELGVNLYMGKPYQEQQLLDGISSLVAAKSVPV